MRLSWFSGSKMLRQRAGRIGRRASAAKLRVRQLERRRVLDGAAASVVVSAITNDVPMPATASSAPQAAPVHFDWTSQAGGDAAMANNAAMAQGAAMNVPPVLVVPLSGSASEGTTLDLSGTMGAPPLALYVDTDMGDLHTGTVNWGDGSATEATTVFEGVGSGALGGTHTYVDQGTYTVTVSVMDSNGGVDTKSFSVVVASVAPTATLANNGPVNEGNSATVTFSNQVDPSSADTTAGFHYSYDFNNDGVWDVGNGSYGGSVTSTSQNVPAGFVPEGPGDYTVKARILDKDGAFTDYTTIIHVNNVAPTLTGIAGDTINENEVATISATIVDPSASDVFSVDVNWLDGSTATITGLGASDSSGTVGDTTYQWTAATRQLQLSHLYLDDGLTAAATDTYNVSLTVHDDDGDSSGPYTAPVVVNNVRPTLVVPLMESVLEGQTLDLSGVGGAPPLGLYVDPGTLDTQTATVDWGDGSAVQNATVIAGVGAGALGGTHVYADDGTYTVTVTVTDKDGGTDTKSFIVKVGNVAPQLSDPADGTINENGIAILTTTVTDPGSKDVFSVDVNWQDGTSDTVSGLGLTDTFGTVGGTTYMWTAATRQLSVSHQYLDDGPSPGNGTSQDDYAVTLTPHDDDMGTGATQTAIVTVKNVAPQISDPADMTINENGTATLTTTINDPGTRDVFSVDVNWQDGTSNTITGLGLVNATGTVGGTTYSWVAATRELTVSHTYLDDGASPGNGTSQDDFGVTLTAHDDDLGTSNIQTAIVTVKNVAPQLSDPADVTINENGTATLTTTITDPGTRDVFSVDVNWQDGSSDTITGLGLSNASGTIGGTTYSWVAATRVLVVSHVYLDDGTSPGNGTSQDNYGATLTAHDDDLGNSATQTAIVTVKNVAPQLSDPADVTINENGTATFTTTITDPGTRDVFSVDVNWQDGSSDTITGLGLVNATGTIGGTTYTWTAATRQLQVSHQYFDDGPSPGNNTSQDDYGVTLTAHDDDLGTSATQTAVATVKNIAPQLSDPADVTINENGTATLTTTITDPGTRDVVSVDVNWQDGSSDTITGLGLVDAMGTVGGTTYVWTAATRQLQVTHQYLDDGPSPGNNTAQDNYGVTLTAHDDDTGTSATQTAIVTVNNVAPTVALNGVSDINENGVATVSGSYTDIGRLDGHTLTVNWGDPNNAANSTFAIPSVRDAAGNATLVAGSTISSADGAVLTIVSVDTTTGLVTFSVQHQYLDDGFALGNGTASDASTITVTVSDDDTASDTKTTTVVVHNVTPALSLNPVASIDENGNATLTGSFTDIGKLDQHTLTINWGDLNNAANSVFTVDTIRDAAGNVTLAPGDTFASADGSTLTIMSVNSTTGVVTFSVQHQYLDDGLALGNNTISDTSTITVTLGDDDMGSDTKSTTVVVNNVTPALSLNAVPSIDENGNATLTGSITDIGKLDQHTLTINWGDLNNAANSVFTIDAIRDAAGNATLVAGDTFTSADGAVLTITSVDAVTGEITFSVQHQYLDDGLAPGNNTASDTSTITVTVADDDATNTTQSTTVTVNNVPPQLSPPAAVTINENSTATITTTLTDPGTRDVFSIDVNWGDGSSATITGLTFTTNASGTIGTTDYNWNSATGELTLSHHYFDDDPMSGTPQDDFTVTLTAHDDDSGSGTTQTIVTVQNVPPTIGLPTVDLPVINEGQTVTLQAGTFSDTLIGFPTENFKAYVLWGDGASDPLVITYDASGGHYAAISHTYLDNDADNKYTISVRVADDDMGAFADESLFTTGVTGVDFSERAIEVTVFNVNPTLNPITATDVNSLGQTTLHITFSDPGADSFRIFVDWGDGAGLHEEVAYAYAGSTPYSFSITHTYLGPPDPNNPAADIQIKVQIWDDDTLTAGVVQDGRSNIEDTLISNPGAQVINVRIDTTPDVPKLEYVPKPINLALFDQQTQPITTLQTQDTSIATSELATSTDRYLELQLISPEGKVVLSYRLKDEALNDLRSLFATLPDGHYKIYLVRTDNNLRRLVMDVFVRRGRIVDPKDESEGSRDRPPTEDGQQKQSQPPENKQQDNATEQLPKGAMQLPQLPAGEVTDADCAMEAVDEVPSAARLRWAAPLAGIGLVAQRGSWSQEVNEAFDRADDQAWKRLRRAGRRRMLK